MAKSIAISKIKGIVTLMKAEGILSLKMPDIEIQIDPRSLFHEEQVNSKEATHTDSTEVKTEDTYTDEQILMWSAPGLPDEGANGEN